MDEVAEETAGDKPETKKPMSQREWIAVLTGGGFAVVMAILLWNAQQQVNEFLRTTLTQKLTETAVAMEKAADQIEEANEQDDRMAEALNDLGRDLGHDNERLVELTEKLVETHTDLLEAVKEREATDDASESVGP